MKIVALICNVVLFLFTCFVLITEGSSRQIAYIVLTLVLLLVPILNVVALSRSGVAAVMRIAAIICNIVLAGIICWAFVDQYPHPDEGSVIANILLIVYMLLVALTPILSAVVLFGGGAGMGWLSLYMKRNTLE